MDFFLVSNTYLNKMSVSMTPIDGE
jgi:hypothetical protein